MSSLNKNFVKEIGAKIRQKNCLKNFAKSNKSVGQPRKSAVWESLGSESTIWEGLETFGENAGESKQRNKEGVAKRFLLETRSLLSTKLRPRVLGRVRIFERTLMRHLTTQLGAIWNIFRKCVHKMRKYGLYCSKSVLFLLDKKWLLFPAKRCIYLNGKILYERFWCNS